MGTKDTLGFIYYSYGTGILYRPPNLTVAFGMCMQPRDLERLMEQVAGRTALLGVLSRVSSAIFEEKSSELRPRYS